MDPILNTWLPHASKITRVLASNLMHNCNRLLPCEVVDNFTLLSLDVNCQYQTYLLPKNQNKCGG